MSNPFNAPLDSLPYYDRDLDAPDQQHLRPAINSLIAVELRSLLPKTPNAPPTNLTHLPASRPLPSSPFLAAELARVESKKPTPPGQGLDTTRYAMPAPKGEAADDVEAWEAAHRSSLAQLEHQRLRTMNGTLLQGTLGANKWKVQNFAMENTVERVDKEGEELRKVVEDVNRRRKGDQEKGGETLSRLEKKWTELVSGNMQLEIGCMAMEAEVAQLQQQHAELTARLAATA
ncbi:Pre-mRNA-splicing factor SPF27 [Leucosporidium creatinivorum]|uniref:Pre-mRNA-splicing factor SPF27 n=1 Tax=Leucosporidium creatinivorum TaxID=106004 RepID=A0A1Y2G1Y4_9BASI|nr:Pre-mRNA-splicing factor SPF27 [Leucosporidium creatinivorum]